MATITTRSGKGTALSHTEMDANFTNLNTDKIEADSTDTLTNKTITSAGNTLTLDAADIADGSVSNTEFQYINSLSSNAQAQLDLALGSFGALAYRSTSQTISDSTGTAIQFTSEDYDTDSIHDNSTNPDRLTVPSGTTKVRLTGEVSFTTNSTGVRWGYITKNGSSFIGGTDLLIDAPSSGSCRLPLTTAVVTVTGGDYFQFNVYQTSGGNLDTTSNSTGNWFAMELIA